MGNTDGALHRDRFAASRSSTSDSAPGAARGEAACVTQQSCGVVVFKFVERRGDSWLSPGSGELQCMLPAFNHEKDNTKIQKVASLAHDTFIYIYIIIYIYMCHQRSKLCSFCFEKQIRS